MAFPDSLVVLPMLGAFGMSMWLHYRSIAPEGASAFGWPFALGLVCLLSIFGFVGLMILAPGWTARKPAFLVLGALLLLGAYAVRRWGTARVKPKAKMVPLGQLSPAAQQAIREQLRKAPPGNKVPPGKER